MAQRCHISFLVGARRRAEVDVKGHYVAEILARLRAW
jgi:hypothetical protein